MSLLTITGTTNKNIIAYVERVYSFLGLDELNAFVDVEFSRACSGGAGGYCDGDEDEINIEIARTDNVGVIDMEQRLINIAHEMIHAHQMASGRLVNCGVVLKDAVMATKQIFDGVEYVGVPYKDQPWEKEAYDAEQEVMKRCL